MDHFRLQFAITPRIDQRLDLFQSLCHRRYHPVWLASFETSLGFLRIALESPNSGDQLDPGKASSHLFADHARRRKCVRRQRGNTDHVILARTRQRQRSWRNFLGLNRYSKPICTDLLSARAEKMIA